jgi:hypothetical protein
MFSVNVCVCINTKTHTYNAEKIELTVVSCGHGTQRPNPQLSQDKVQVLSTKDVWEK